MSTTIYVNGTPYSLNADKALGEGGEARVFQFKPEVALRVLKLPGDPSFDGRPDLNTAARRRVQEIQEKLPRFPKGLPDNVLVPLELAYDRPRGGQIVGHTMRFISGAKVLKELADRTTRESIGIDQNAVVDLFRGMYDTFQKTHERQVVIGDSNSLNFLARGKEVYFIDTPSYQTPGFFCTAFMPLYVDPMVCRVGKQSPMEMCQPHSVYTDWYAFWVLLFETMLYAHPYDGIYRPKDPEQRVNQDSRPLKRITVFHPEVRYPSSGIPWQYLPDELIEFYRSLLEQDKRQIGPRHLLDNLEWTKCANCGVDHARKRCPSCTHMVVVVREQVIGDYIADTVFKTNGVILHAALEGELGETLRYVYYLDGAFYREGGTLVCHGKPCMGLQFHVKGQDTLVSIDGETKIVRGDGTDEIVPADLLHGQYPVCDANARHYYWVNGNTLYRDGQDGPVALTTVLNRQTSIWVGSDFGFGFFRAMPFQRAFLFDALVSGEKIIDLPRITGRILSMLCSFSSNRLWLFVASEEMGVLTNTCYVIRRDGSLESQTKGRGNDGTWLGTILGKVAAYQPSTKPNTSGHEFLLSTSQDGVIRLQVEDGVLIERATFKGTEDLVDEKDHLLFSPAGLYAWNSRGIRLIKKTKATV